MRKLKMALAIVGLMFLSSASQANGKVIRATDLGNRIWSDFAQGKLGDIIVEFRQGDDLPVSFEAQGDLIETRQNSVSYVSVKKTFWLRLSQNDIEISLDGTTFKKINDVLTGSIGASAGAAQIGGVANAINIVFKAFIK